MMEKEKSLERYKLAIDARNLEINLFWQRSVFYWGFIAAALIAYSELIDKHKFTSFAIALFGFFLSVCWLFLNKGSKWWQENWEIKIAKLEENETTKLFSGGENPKEKQGGWLGAKRYSPSKLTIGVSYMFSFFWFCIIAKDIYLQFSISDVSDYLKSLTYIISPIVLFFVLIFLLVSSRGED